MTADRRNLLAALAVGVLGAALIWLVPGAQLVRVVGGGVLVGVALIMIVVVWKRSGSEGGDVSSFIRVGKGAKLTESKVSGNTSSADNFIDLGDESTIEETSIEGNVHAPADTEG